MSDMKLIMEGWRKYHIQEWLRQASADELLESLSIEEVQTLVNKGLIDEGLMDLAKSKLAPYAMGLGLAAGGAAMPVGTAMAAPTTAAASVTGFASIEKGSPQYQKALKDLANKLVEGGVDVDNSLAGDKGVMAGGFSEASLDDFALAAARFGAATSPRGYNFMISKAVKIIKGELAQGHSSLPQRVRAMGQAALEAADRHASKAAKKAPKQDQIVDTTTGNINARIFANAANYNTAKINDNQKEMKKYEAALGTDIDQAFSSKPNKAAEVKGAIFGGGSVDFAKARTLLGLTK